MKATPLSWSLWIGGVVALRWAARTLPSVSQFPKELELRWGKVLGFTSSSLNSTCIRAQRIIKIASAIVFFRGNAFRCPTTCQAQIATRNGCNNDVHITSNTLINRERKKRKKVLFIFPRTHLTIPGNRTHLTIPQYNRVLQKARSLNPSWVLGSRHIQYY